MENPIDLMRTGEPNGRGIVCLSCLKENDSAAVYCRYCNSALQVTNNPDPIQKLSHEGVVYSKAVEGKPKLVVLIGVWLLFFPVLIFSLITAVSMAFEGERGSSGFIFFWFLVISAFFSLTMIYKVTKNYFKSKKKNV